MDGTWRGEGVRGAGAPWLIIGLQARGGRRGWRLGLPAP
jgi:hypothetical protein